MKNKDDIRGQGDVDSLLKEAVEAARAGNKAEARRLAEQVLEIDDESIRAWMLLYRFVDDVNEKRICLTTILQLDPKNEKARQALAQLDAKISKTKGDEEVIPGVTRRQLTLLVGAGGVVIVLLVAVVLIVTISGNARRAGEARETQNVIQTAVAFDSQLTQAIIEQTEEVTAAAQTLFAQSSPTATSSPTLSGADNFPATWTPTTEATATLPVTALPYPEGVPGTILGWSGRDFASNDLLPIVSFPLSAGGQSTRIGSENGRNVTVTRDGQLIVYTRFYPIILVDVGLEAIRAGSQPEDLGQRWLPYEQFLVRAEMPFVTADGSQVVFVAEPPDAQTKHVYLMSLTVQGANPLVRLTNDQAGYSYPVLSPDGSKVVAVRVPQGGLTAGGDLVTIDVGSRTQTPLTSDLGNFLETTPRFTPDGRQIAYAAAAATDPQNHDIILLNADGSGVPALPVRNPADDLFPVFSPDGRYLAFSSNRGGAYDIYIFDLTNGQLWQLTNTVEEDYPGGWIQ